MTRKLYYDDPRLRRFTASVTACEPCGEGFAVILDQTAFYPEGGGQPTDLGSLNGLPVQFVRDRGDEILHLMKEPLAPGTPVEGVIDADRRDDLTVQHSGEHILSGLICRHFSCDNVGFHISEDFVTIDFNAQIGWEELLPLEAEANRLVRADLPVHIFYPTPEELEKLAYRSKKALSGAVRIVEFPGADVCACCGTHVVTTGEIGLIKLVSCESHRGGVRIQMASGARALAYVNMLWRENSRVSQALSAKPEAIGAAAERAVREILQLKSRCALLEESWLTGRASGAAGKGPLVFTEQGLSADSTRRLCDSAASLSGHFTAVLSDCGEEGIRYCIAHPNGDLKALTAALNSRFSGRGGGKPFFVQGTLHGEVSAVCAFLKDYLPELTEA